MPAFNFSPADTSIPNERNVRVSITGASTSDPTKRVGHGVTVTRTAQGVLKFAFAENLGTFVGLAGKPALRADTASGVKGFDVTAGAYVAPSGTTPGSISLSVWDASNAAVDLTSVQYLDVSFVFAWYPEAELD